MSTMPDFTNVLEEYGIIGDVLPAGTKVSHNLGIHWSKVNLRAPGERLPRDDVQEQPTVTTTFKPETASGEDYVLLMVDPDLTQYNDQKFGQVRHWLVARATISTTGDVLVGIGVTVSPYVGPAPLATNLIGESRPSRYTFLLLKHKAGTAPLPTFDPDSLRAELEGAPGQFGGENQHLLDRVNFDTRAFMEKNGLEVVAATFMFVEGNVKSTLANASLLASSVAKKVLGQ